jgi:ParB-like chromosome segregation protein Spo0J
MEIINKNIDDLIPYEKNPRHNENAVQYVKESIRNFGFKVPIIIDKNNVIIAGHTRLLGAKELGFETVPCIVANDLTKEQVKAFRLADNKVGEFSNWDFGLLEEELSGILDIDMGDFGFVNFEETEVNLDDFFEEAEAKPKEPKKIQCPHCGEWFEQ